MFTIALINPLSFLLSLSTMLGVMVHDTKIDRLTVTALSVTVVAVASYDGAVKLAGNDLHTHSERVSVAEMVRNLNSQTPRIQPRTDDRKKYQLQRNDERGHRPFEDYELSLA